MKKHLPLFLFLITLWIMPFRVSAMEEDTADNANDSDNTSQRSNQDQDSERQNTIAANQENHDGITDNPLTPPNHIDSTRRVDHSFSADEYKTIDQDKSPYRYTAHSPNQDSMSFPRTIDSSASSSSAAASAAGADVEYEREGASTPNRTSSDGRIEEVAINEETHRRPAASASSGGAAAAIDPERVAVPSETAVTIAERSVDQIVRYNEHYQPPSLSECAITREQLPREATESHASQLVI